MLPCQWEHGNVHNPYNVAIIDRCIVVCHVPHAISSAHLMRKSSTILCVLCPQKFAEKLPWHLQIREIRESFLPTSFPPHGNYNFLCHFLYACISTLSWLGGCWAVTWLACCNVKNTLAIILAINYLAIQHKQCSSHRCVFTSSVKDGIDPLSKLFLAFLFLPTFYLPSGTSLLQFPAPANVLARTYYKIR